MPTPCIINGWFPSTKLANKNQIENPRGFSIWFLFANLVA